MSKSLNWKEQSKIDWSTQVEDDVNCVGLEKIKTGALQRIADATEKMAINHTRLINERDQYEQWYRRERKDNERLHKQVAAYKGVITKMKKRNK